MVGAVVGVVVGVGQVADLERGIPVAFDVVVSQGTRVVTITGPNTGGKTAAIKTVALAALMAKAGTCREKALAFHSVNVSVVYQGFPH